MWHSYLGGVTKTARPLQVPSGAVHNKVINVHDTSALVCPLQAARKIVLFTALLQAIYMSDSEAISSGEHVKFTHILQKKAFIDMVKGSLYDKLDERGKKSSRP